ncbi:hypothetical protein KQX54_007366 [Cotesia glomerata]|uniref:Kinesin-like protein KIF2A-like N-terminal domain-containing protein n=1 Tax=Cotesia glomerata TaxID=32391 RepID=A0AAV7I217_COTGL|nr:hypothetical protein KQX54_007366 [Cotesia glomerata]
MMDWLSKCVCGSKEAKKQKKKKKKHAKKNNDKIDVYVIDDNDNDRSDVNVDDEVIKNNNTVSLSRVNEDRGREEEAKSDRVTSDLEDCRQKEVTQINGVDRQVNCVDKNKPVLLNGDEFSAIDIGEREPEFYDSLSDTSPVETLQKEHSMSMSMSLHQFSRSSNQMFVQDREKDNPLQNKLFGETEVVKSTSENDFRFNSNSCSFIVPIADDPKRKKHQTRIKNNKNKKISSSIPIPSKHRNSSVSSPHIKQNGRIHSAIVSGVNWEQQSVTVEWFERGETKGKEFQLMNYN